MLVAPCVFQRDPPDATDGTPSLKHRGAVELVALRHSEVSTHPVHSVILIRYSQFSSRRRFVSNSHDRLTPCFPVLQCRKSVGETF